MKNQNRFLVFENTNFELLFHHLVIGSCVLTQSKELFDGIIVEERQYKILKEKYAYLNLNFQVYEQKKEINFQFFRLLIVFVFKWLFIFDTRLIRLSNIDFGDIFVDQFCRESELGIYPRYRNFYKKFGILKKLIFELIILDSLFTNKKFANSNLSLITTHKVGISSIFYRKFLQKNRAVYLFFGQGKVSFSRRLKLETRGHYELSPMIEDLPAIERSMLGLSRIGGIEGNLKSEIPDFWFNFKIKIIIYLHGFTDYPNSHFTGQGYFFDFGHWFRECLKFAATNDEYLFVFKEHPYKEIYRTQDINTELEIANLKKENVVLLKENLSNSIIANTFEVCLTVSGSCGYELPAINPKIMVIRAGSSMYNDFSFTQFAHSKKLYFHWLSNLSVKYNDYLMNCDLSDIQKQAFLFGHYLQNLSRIKFEESFELTLNDHKNFQQELIMDKLHKLLRDSLESNNNVIRNNLIIAFFKNCNYEYCSVNELSLNLKHDKKD